MAPINLRYFWENNELIFDSFQKGLSWIKRHMSLESLRRVSQHNYIVDSTEIYCQSIVQRECYLDKRSGTNLNSQSRF
jgi:hypothetical protein